MGHILVQHLGSVHGVLAFVLYPALLILHFFSLRAHTCGKWKLCGAYLSPQVLLVVSFHIYSVAVGGQRAKFNRPTDTHPSFIPPP